jgi:fructose-1,6-bisphosphatase/inositol monophosphatase family enzyme
MAYSTQNRAFGRADMPHGRRESEPDSRNGLAQDNLITAITSAALKTMRIVHRTLADSVLLDPGNAFETVKIGEREKVALGIDFFAERLASVELGRRLRRYNPLILGEESLRKWDLDLGGVRRIVVLLDTVDGTDLFARGLSNWCSAATFFLPADRQILGAFVGTPEGIVYYWTPATPVPLKFNLITNSTAPVSGPSAVKNMLDASVAFYGQKASSFCVNGGPLAHERNLQLRTSGLGFRLYNLAGIPAMVKLIDDGDGARQRLDAVYEISGQQPHDVVAGAVIAQRAGATLVGLDGVPLDFMSALLRPADPESRLRYVLAATPELAENLLRCLLSETSPQKETQKTPPEFGELAA